MSNEFRLNARNLTQRLDHMVPDPDLSPEENRAAANELELLSSMLFELLPDKSLSPLERVERLARTIEARDPDLSQLQSAAQKVKVLKARINDLVGGPGSAQEKIGNMLKSLDQLVADDQKGLPTIKKLELLGDPRGKVEPE